MSQSLPPAVIRRRPRDRKQQILTQARDLFVELGYHNVTMSAIAERVGIAPSALYRHFANKMVLLEAVIEDSFSDLPLPSGDLSLQDVLSETSAIAVARPLGVLWSREARHLPEQSREAVRATLRRSALSYVRLIAQERPELSQAQADLLAWAIQSVMASPSYRSVRISAAEHVAALTAASLAILRAPLPSPAEQIPAEQDRADRRGRPALTPVSRRERLLLAAMRLFAERGYQETALDDIGAAAEVTGPNLYSYFDSKAAVLRAVMERGTHALWLDLQDALRASCDPREALAVVAAGYVRLRPGMPNVGRQLTGEPDVDEIARSYQREYVAEWVGLLRHARPELDQRTARLLVHIAIAVADDLTATRHLASTADAAACITTVVVAVLGAKV